MQLIHGHRQVQWSTVQYIVQGLEKEKECQGVTIPGVYQNNVEFLSDWLDFLAIVLVEWQYSSINCWNFLLSTWDVANTYRFTSTSMDMTSSGFWGLFVWGHNITKLSPFSVFSDFQVKFIVKSCSGEKRSELVQNWLHNMNFVCFDSFAKRKLYGSLFRIHYFGENFAVRFKLEVIVSDIGIYPRSMMKAARWIMNFGWDNTMVTAWLLLPRLNPPYLICLAMTRAC